MVLTRAKAAKAACAGEDTDGDHNIINEDPRATTVELDAQQATNDAIAANEDYVDLGQDSSSEDKMIMDEHSSVPNDLKSADDRMSVDGEVNDTVERTPFEQFLHKQMISDMHAKQAARKLKRQNATNGAPESLPDNEGDCDERAQPLRGEAVSEQKILEKMDKLWASITERQSITNEKREAGEAATKARRKRSIEETQCPTPAKQAKTIDISMYAEAELDEMIDDNPPNSVKKEAPLDFWPVPIRYTPHPRRSTNTIGYLTTPGDEAAEADARTSPESFCINTGNQGPMSHQIAWGGVLRPPPQGPAADPETTRLNYLQDLLGYRFTDIQTLLIASPKETRANANSDLEVLNKLAAVGSAAVDLVIRRQDFADPQTLERDGNKKCSKLHENAPFEQIAEEAGLLPFIPKWANAKRCRRRVMTLVGAVEIDGGQQAVAAVMEKLGLI